jgi:integral membrane sensor domain MASE1
MLNVDVTLDKRRDMMIFVIFGIVINNAFGALWGTVTLAIGNMIAWTEVTPAFFAWFIGNVIVTALIVPLALRYVTPKIEKSKVFVRHYWD